MNNERDSKSAAHRPLIAPEGIKRLMKERDRVPTGIWQDITKDVSSNDQKWLDYGFFKQALSQIKPATANIENVIVIVCHQLYSIMPSGFSFLKQNFLPL